MASRFSVDLDRLDETISRLSGLVGFVEDNLTELDRQVAALPAVWKGDAADAHAEARRQWQIGATDLREGLDVMRVAAKRAHDEYRSAVTTNLEMLGRGGVP